MSCETAFRTIARHCLRELNASQPATRGGDSEALHDMRIALTRLRAAMSFFSPMAADPKHVRLKQDLKWLNGQLGAARDVDVAIARLTDIRALHVVPDPLYRSWQQKSAESHQRLAHALGSERYRRLIKATSDWIENGSWCTTTDPRVMRRRGKAITRYCTTKLARWRAKLLKQSLGKQSLGKQSLRKQSLRLADMGAKKRHRLRLASKRLRYSIEFFTTLLPGASAPIGDTLKQLRKAQAALGELNDGSQSEALAAALPQDDNVRVGSWQFLDSKRERQLLQRASRAYRKLSELPPPGA